MLRAVKLFFDGIACSIVKYYILQTNSRSYYQCLGIPTQIHVRLTPQENMKLEHGGLAQILRFFEVGTCYIQQH